MDPHFCLEVPIRVGTNHRNNRPLYPCLLARLEIEDLRLEASPFAPPTIHPKKHLGPVLGLGPPRPGVDREDGIAAIVRAREDDPDLELADPLLERLDRPPDLF